MWSAFSFISIYSIIMLFMELKMARKVDPFAPYRMSTHKLGKYVYVCTQPASVDEVTGKRTYRRIHWGCFDPQKKTFTC